MINQPLTEHLNDALVELGFVFEIEGEFFGGEQANRHPDAGVSQGKVLLQTRFDECFQCYRFLGQYRIANVGLEIGGESIVLELQNRT